MSGRQREIVYCHSCESEWYRDEGGLTCPECHSEFVEVVEPDHDPRNDDAPPIPPRPDVAPDPDEDDITDMGWQSGPQGGMTFRYSGADSRGVSGQGRTPQGQGNLLDSFTSMFGSILGGQPVPPGWQHQHHIPSPFAGPPNPSSGPYTSQRAQAPSGSRTTIRSGGGPGFSWSVTTSHGGGTRTDSGSDVPMRMPLQMLFGPGMAMPNPGGHDPSGRHDVHDHDPFTQMSPFGQLFATLMNPAMARGGDAVYTQEALDRVISQLMEQNATGNAPGPASADAIESLPRRDITEKDLGEEGKAECSICMDEVNIGQQVTELPCHHWFHGDCVRAWLHEHDTCPHCRQGIMPKEGDGGRDTASRPRAPEEAPRHDVMWGQGNGSRSSPWVISDSPERPERIARPRPAGQEAGPSHDPNNDGLFSRMRNAFGGGAGGQGGGGS